MKLKLIPFYLFLGLFFSSSAPSKYHPLKLTSSLLEYNQEAKSIRMECRVFIDDFENTINKKFTDEMVVSNLSEADKEGISRFFNTYYKVWINEEKLVFTYDASEIIKDYNVFIIKFAESDLSIKKGDKLKIENTLFYEEFGFKQTNRITLRFAPFLNEAFYSATEDNYTINHNF